jgi:3-oxoacyl-[acyl-carrier-protein] synthase III
MDGTNASLGIAAIATYEPPWLLGNEWFAGTIPRKFAQHTGIEARAVSTEDEVAMAVRVVKNLQRDVGCDLQDCAGLVFVSPSFVPLSVARKFWDESRVRYERLRRAARLVARRLEIQPRLTTGLNWFCSGYSKAFEITRNRLAPRLRLAPHEFILVVTSTQISRITDYGCPQTGGLFGDLATATLVSRTDSHQYPVHFELLHAAAEKRPVDKPFFDFHLRHDVLTPHSGGQSRREPERVVFSLDGMGIADVAPRAMSSALAASLSAAGVAPADIRYVVPHQAGTAIVRLAGMKIEELGVRGKLINGMTARSGNVSAGSIPYTLKAKWRELSGTIACPTAAVGDPGLPEVSQGCVLLRATPLHERQAGAAA